MARLFKKTWKVVIVGQPQPSAGFVAQNPQFFETSGNAVEIKPDPATGEGTRVSFTVTKTVGKEPNKGTVKLYNLSSSTRGLLDQTPVKIYLHVGYDGAPRLLFSGDLRYSNTRQEGTELVTTLEIRDGARAYANARMTERSYRPPIRVHQVLTDAAATMNLSLPPEAEQSVELKQALATGISAHGPTREVLTRLLAPYGMSWSIQEGTLVILKDGQLRPGEAVLVNESTGLIGSPERAVPDKPGARVPVSFDVLVYPEISPAMPVKLESKFINGVFRVKECTSEGDSHDDGEWKTSVRSEPT